MSDSGVERRGDPRVPIELKVEYKKVNTFFFDYTRNISKGGTFIRTERPLPRGTEFLFKLVIPHLPEPLTLRGQVKWVVSAEQAALDREADPGMGIGFVYQTDAARRFVEQTVERLMIDELGERAYAKLMGRA